LQANIRVRFGNLMKVLFVTEAAARIGGGHLMRCLTLAADLARSGNDITFIVNTEAPVFAPSLARSGIPFETVDAIEDAACLAARRNPDAIVFDSYGFNAKMERRFRPLHSRLVAIDDLANRPHDCDLLIDSTIGRTAHDYKGLLPEAAIALTGTAYAPLRPEFTALREQALRQRALRGDVKRILVSLGLTDLGGITMRVVPLLLDLAPKAEIYVVIGPAAPSRVALKKLAVSASRVSIHIDPQNMADLMAMCDLAVGAGGTTSWERCCVGLPTILFVLAENQRLIASRLGKAGAVLPVRGTPTPDIDDFAAKVAALIDDVVALRRMSVVAAAIVDGGGTERIAQSIKSLVESRV
jgi:UDP-2,4-diacetamido-2,4,6-trideoxy-beta-L-altropyranose hydrolase